MLMAAQMTMSAIAVEERFDTDSSPNSSLRDDTRSDTPYDDPSKAPSEYPITPSK
jgi:hypothetical protein